jgi:transcriptional regulator with GAF, ATPase, and Fis domain
MRELEGTAAWFHFCGASRPTEDDIRRGLSNAGIHLRPLATTLPEGHGILAFSEIGDELLGLLHHIRLRARGHVLALAAIPSALQDGGNWRLLHAGASEVLAWDHQAVVEARILARLERWTTIDELTEAATSQVALVGESASSYTLLRRIVEAARFTDVPILLSGESGTGKELLARLVHLMDARHTVQSKSGPGLVTVDCSTIVPELSGSELFGHERGAFTGAVSFREGAFALADGGTLFLDEIGELPMNLQTQLLRAIQEKTYKRVGGNVWQTSDFRLVCATNRDLNELVKQSHFRLDLYHRIAGWVYRTLPLRERREDILPLADHFLNTVNARHEPTEFDPAVCDYLLHRTYAGNVRELRQLVERMAHRHVGPGPVTIGDIPEEDRPPGTELQHAWPDEKFEKSIVEAVALGTRLKEITQATSETAIRIAVQSEKGNLQRAARRLGITDRALQMRRASGKIPS